MEKAVSSEEKLLKHIRKKSPNKEQKVKKEKVRRPVFTKGGFDKLNIVNKLLVVISAACIGMIGYKSYLSQQMRVESILSEPNVKDPGFVIKAEKESALTPFSRYAEEFEKRDIFNTSFFKPKTQNIVKDIPQAVNPIAKLILVGVVLDEEPQAIIVDMQSEETLFLKVGESVQGNQITEIKEGQVLLENDGEQYELNQ